MRVEPAVATLAQASELREAIGAKQARFRIRARANASAIKAHADRVSVDTRRLARSQVQAHRRTAQKAIAEHTRQHQKLSAVSAAQRAEANKMADQHTTWIRWSSQRNRLDQLVLASSLPLVAAYGRNGTLWDANNMTLGVLAGIWLLGDKVTDFLGGTKVPEPGVRSPDVWSYLTPAANVLLAWLLLRDRQNERFIDGFASAFVAVREQTQAGTRDTVLEQHLDLLPFIAPLHREDFVGFLAVPAIATVAEVQWTPAAMAGDAHIAGVTAQVQEGVLRLSVVVRESVRLPEMPPPALEPLVTSLKVAWLVDTKESA